MKNLSELNFNNRFVNQLKVDSIEENYPRQVFDSFYSNVIPKKMSAPSLVCASQEVAQLIDLNISEFNNPLFAEIFSGHHLLSGMQSHATCYGGHQFGNWAGQLGDGRAINLGEVKNSRNEHWTLQLKGAGPTPYSRTADGFAVLRSSIREFLCSEAMHHLGVPTTRALSLIETGERVKRDMFYNGNPQWEPGAVVCRVAPSFIRFGHFEIFSARKDLKNLRVLMDFCIRNDFPELVVNADSTELTTKIYAEWFAEICRRTGILMAHWMRVGFVHGVMNTDNMSILGLTIDYGPYGWLEPFDPDWTPNTTDAQFHRYAFGQQPEIALWNLTQLANAIFPVLQDVDLLKAGLQIYQTTYAQEFQLAFNNKLGFNQDWVLEADWLDDLFSRLEHSQIDMTLFFRQLGQEDWIAENNSNEYIKNKFHELILAATYKDLSAQELEAWDFWLKNYQEQLKNNFIIAGELFSARQARMNRANPIYVLRNYLAQQAIDKAEQGDYSEVTRLYELLKNPYQEQKELFAYSAKRPQWAASRPGCSSLSCSS